MKFKDEQTAKQFVSEIMSSEYIDVVSGKGLFFNENVIYDTRFSHITNCDDYPLINQKIKSIVSLVNEDASLIYEDLEEKLWNLSN